MSFQFGNKLSTSGSILSLDAGNRASYNTTTNAALKRKWIDISRSSIDSSFSPTNVPFYNDFGGYFYFDSTDPNAYMVSDYGDARNSVLNIGGALLTIEAVIRTKGNIVGSSVIFQFGYTNKLTPTSLMSYGMGIQSDRLATITRTGVSSILTTGADITPAKWQHVVITYLTTTRVASYVNGVLTANATNGNFATFAADNSLASYSVGAQSDGSSGISTVNADIALLKVYNRNMPAAEVLNNYLFYRTRFNI